VVIYKYFYFHISDLEEVIESVKKLNVRLSPKFGRYSYTEINISSDDVIIGKYKKIGFVFDRTGSDKDPEFDFLKKVIVEVTVVDDTFHETRFAKLKVEEDGDLIKIDRESDVLFLDLIPATYSELIKAEILLNECNLLAELISKEETDIVSRVKNFSNEVKTGRVVELEKISFEVTEFQMEFFKKFMDFKNINEELFSAIVRFDAFSRKLGGWYLEKSVELKDYFESLRYFESKFEQTTFAVRDLYSLVSLRLDMLRNNEFLEMQKRTSSLQAAAAIIEFVAVFYYTFRIWDYFLPVNETPPQISFIILTAFTTSIVGYTEVISELIRGKRVTKSFLIVTFLLIIILCLMVYIPLLFSGAWGY